MCWSKFVNLFKRKKPERRVVEIDVFLDNVNWYSLLTKQWGLCDLHTACEVIPDIKKKKKAVKKTWLASDSNITLGQILVSQKLLDKVHYRTNRGHLVSYDNKWYFMDLKELLKLINK